VTHLEKQTDESKKRMSDFQDKLEGKWKVESTKIPDSAVRDVIAPMLISLENEDDEFLDEFNRVIKDPHLAKAEDDHDTPSEYGVEDSYLDMELGIRRDDEGLHHARVKRRAVDKDGNPTGRPNNNPLLDSRKYEVEYADGNTEVIVSPSRQSRTKPLDD
jgi:hypothetical protein